MYYLIPMAYVASTCLYVYVCLSKITKKTQSTTTTTTRVHYMHDCIYSMTHVPRDLIVGSGGKSALHASHYCLLRLSSRARAGQTSEDLLTPLWGKLIRKYHLR